MYTCFLWCPALVAYSINIYIYTVLHRRGEKKMHNKHCLQISRCWHFPSCYMCIAQCLCMFWKSFFGVQMSVAVRWTEQNGFPDKASARGHDGRRTASTVRASRYNRSSTAASERSDGHRWVRWCHWGTHHFPLPCLHQGDCWQCHVLCYILLRLRILHKEIHQQCGSLV